MDNYEDIIISVICEFARIIVILRYCSIFLRNKGNRIIKYSIMCIVALITIFSYQIFHNMWGNLIVTYLGIFIAMIFYEGTLKKKVLFSVSIYAMCALMDLIAAFIVMENPNADNQNMASSFLSVILFLVSVIIIEKIYVNKTYGDINEKHWIYLLVLSTTSICSMLIIFCDISISRISMLSISVVFVIINFIVYGLYVSMEERYMEMIENANLKNQLKAYDQQIQLNIDNEKQIRTLKHDMKHHLREIYSLAATHNDEKIKLYIDQMLESIHIDQMISSSGNMCIDGIVNYMCCIAKEKEIETKVNVAIPENLQLDAYDFNIIIGNLFENAIEASEKLEGAFIQVNINYAANCIFISFENKYNGIINKKEKLISKKGIGHGLGIDSVKTIVEKYNGSFNYKLSSNIFMVKVTLFM